MAQTHPPTPSPAPADKKSMLKMPDESIWNPRHWFKSLSQERLESSLPWLVNEIHFYQQKSLENQQVPEWLVNMEYTLSQIEEALQNFKPEKGWKLYKQVARNLIRADYEHRPDYCRAHASAILNEAMRKMEKDSWRQKTVVEALTSPVPGDASPKLKLDLLREDIVYATKMMDEHQDNFYERLRIFKCRTRHLTFATVVCLACWVWLNPTVGNFPPATHLLSETEASVEKGEAQSGQTALELSVEDPAQTSADSLGNLPPESAQTPTTAAAAGQKSTTESVKPNPPATVQTAQRQPSSRQMSVLVILAGFIGAVVSNFLRTIRQMGRSSTIPNELFGGTVMWARLSMATVAALAIYIFLGTGLVFVFQKGVSFELLLAFSFVAGFTERLVQNSVSRLTKEDLYAGNKQESK